MCGLCNQLPFISSVGSTGELLITEREEQTHIHTQRKRVRERKKEKERALFGMPTSVIGAIMLALMGKLLKRQWSKDRNSQRTSPLQTSNKIKRNTTDKLEMWGSHFSCAHFILAVQQATSAVWWSLISHLPFMSLIKHATGSEEILGLKRVIIHNHCSARCKKTSQ